MSHFRLEDYAWIPCAERSDVAEELNIVECNIELGEVGGLVEQSEEL